MAKTEAKKDLQLLRESFEKFMKNHTETMKSSGGEKEKVNEIMKLQETLFNNMNECIDDVIPKEVPDSKIFDAEIEFIFKADDQTVLETFVQNPGLQHLAENIFLNLNFNALKNCTNVNEDWKKFLNDPMFPRGQMYGNNMYMSPDVRMYRAYRLGTPNARK